MQGSVAEAWNAADHERKLVLIIGDASEGGPGVPGIGAKTASKLLKEYGTLEQVLAAAPQQSSLI